MKVGKKILMNHVGERRNDYDLLKGDLTLTIRMF